MTADQSLIDVLTVVIIKKLKLRSPWSLVRATTTRAQSPEIYIPIIGFFVLLIIGLIIKKLFFRKI